MSNFGSNRATKGLAVGGLIILTLTGCSGLGGKKSVVEERDVTGERISIFADDEGVGPDPQLATVTVRLPEPQPLTEWPQPGGNVSNVLHHVRGKVDLKKKWKRGIGKGDSLKSRISASPIVADGKIFAMDARGEISALNAETGNKIWQKDLSPKGEKAISGFGGGVAYDMERLFVSTGFGHVYALEPDTGEVIWKRKYGIPFRAAPTAAGGRVFVTTVDNQLHAMSGFDGAPLWSYRGLRERAGILADTNPAVEGDILIAPFSSGEITAILVQNGQQAWTDSLTKSGRQSAITNISAIAGRPAVQGGQIIAISHAGRLVAIDVRSGERMWTRDIGGTQTPWLSGDFIYLVSSDAQVMCLTRRDGRIRWIAQLNEFMDPDHKKRVLWTGPIMVGNELLLFSSHGRYVGLSPYTGALLERGKFGEGVNVAPIVANGIVYIIDREADIYALEGDRDLAPTEANVAPENVGKNGVIDLERQSKDGKIPFFN